MRGPRWSSGLARYIYGTFDFRGPWGPRFESRLHLFSDFEEQLEKIASILSIAESGSVVKRKTSRDTEDDVIRTKTEVDFVVVLLL